MYIYIYILHEVSANSDHAFTWYIQILKARIHMNEKYRCIYVVDLISEAAITMLKPSTGYNMEKKVMITICMFSSLNRERMTQLGQDCYVTFGCPELTQLEQP